jgi:hypothetical protein
VFFNFFGIQHTLDEKTLGGAPNAKKIEEDPCFVAFK